MVEAVTSSPKACGVVASAALAAVGVDDAMANRTTRVNWQSGATDSMLNSIGGRVSPRTMSLSPPAPVEPSTRSIVPSDSRSPGSFCLCTCPPSVCLIRPGSWSPSWWAGPGWCGAKMSKKRYVSASLVSGVAWVVPSAGDDAELLDDELLDDEL